MKKILLTLGLLLSVFISSANTQERSPAPEMAEAYIQSPADGSAVSSPVTIRFGLRGIGVAPAGIERPNTGHHHLLINIADAEMPSFDLPLPATDQVRHFGLGQTETLLELEPGQHTLQLVLGDHLHIPHASPVVSEKITITVTE
ncbi:MAG: rod shape-determining protein RodA [Gammaproteobacteria bacterium]|nr:rod shape-determining protein RodA [Gammaproteobacteria bacterium]|tara:strand:- start:2166 stop:2600 length:435 start_codon:yes stop_codon:yes gene_type:complete